MDTTRMIPRPCPICGSEQRKELGVRSFELPATPDPVHWELHDAVCLYCGFVYSWKVYPDAYINDYYSRTTAEVKADYSGNSRIALIKRYLPDGGSILEYGPGASGLCDLLDDNYGVDVSNASDKTPARKYDLTAAYYVLEHVSDPRNFVYGMRFATKPGGFVVVEVPDLVRRPREALYPEHLNYFTEPHLRILLETSGIAVVECIHGHSRDFGMAVVGIVKPCIVTEAKLLHKAGRGGCEVSE